MTKPPRDAEDRARAAELAARADALSARAMEVTTPAYCPNTRKEPEPVGTAVLLALGDVRFLITAAHVLDLRNGRPMLVQAGGTIMPIGGEVVRIQHTAASKPADDHVDIGIVRLSGGEWQSVPGSQFLGWLELDHSASVATLDAFAVVGYVLSQQKNAIKGTELHAWAYRMVAVESQDEVYASLGYDPNVSLVLNFEKRRMWGPEGQHTAPNLYGVSGGGVWRFGRRLRDATGAARLAAVVIECHTKTRHKHILATRVRPIIAALTQRYSDMREIVTSFVGGAA
jgi:hypothetical protein